MDKKWRLYKLGILSFLGSLLFWIASASPGYSHWADLAVAEVVVSQTQTQITLTFPTGLVASADDNQDGQLSPDEVHAHQAALQSFLSDRLHLTDGEGNNGALTLKPLETATLPSNLQVTAGTHTTLLLVYTWPKAIQGLKIRYDLFLPGVPTASCMATILQPNGQVQSVVFRPENREFSLMPGAAWLAGSLPLAIAGAFVWGAMHTLSPGHGKTVVGAYLVGAHATPKHALFLGLTTTITHTAGVFALGLGTLLISNFILPKHLYPWLSFLSGLMVVAIGLNLFICRMRSAQRLRKSLTRQGHPGYHDEDHFHHHAHNHSHSHLHSDSHHHSHPHDPPHSHTHDHLHDPYHHHHRQSQDHNHRQANTIQIQNPSRSLASTNASPTETLHERPKTQNPVEHSHLPPGADGSPVTWRSLLALGISGGLVPCPSALVVLLSAISLGNTGFGLVLVLAFSLGLAGVLTGLGLLLVYTKRLFERVPTNVRLMKMLPAMRILPAASALLIVVIGLGMTVQALIQAELVRL